jgi:hypothetical protein
VLGLSELDPDVGIDSHNEKGVATFVGNSGRTGGRRNEIQIDPFCLTFIKRVAVRCYRKTSISPQKPNAQGKTDPQ